MQQNSARRHPASYRDPGSSVFTADGRVLRAFTAEGHAQHRFARESGLLDELIEAGLLVATRDAPEAHADPAFAHYAHVVEHDAIPFVSYPYEWPFALLRSAALLQLDVHLRALARGVTLSDASAYNVQFRGVSPVFIDAGSFRPYVEGELWSGHRQFCEQFLNPLLLFADLEVPYNAWLRGSLEGIPIAALAALAPARRWLSLRYLIHVLLPARGERVARGRERQANERIRQARLPLEGYRAMLNQLRRWIEQLAPKRAFGTTWADYSRTRTYEDSESATKRRVVQEFTAACRPGTLWDLGCNDGEFGQAALAAGAGRVIGFDADAGALDRACARAAHERLDLLPLYQDAADPSPPLGWRGRERAGLLDRPRPDAVMALAFEHHLALGRNVPLEEVVDFIAGLAPRGLIEFVPKSDPTVQRMLALKGDIFPTYDEASFVHCLEARARIVRREKVSGTGRELFWFER